MFIAVIAGYMLASLLCLCGVINLILFCCDGWDGMDIAVFSAKLATAAWPLLGGIVLCLLIQIATFLEKLCFLKSQEQLNSATHVYRKTHGHRTFGCATDSFVTPPEHITAQIHQEAHAVEHHEHRPVPHIAPHAPAKHTPAPPAQPVSAAQPPQPAPAVPADGHPVVGYSDALLASRGIQPGTFFHAPAVPPAPETPAGGNDTHDGENAAPAAGGGAPGAGEAPKPEAPKGPALSFFHVD